MVNNRLIDNLGFAFDKREKNLLQMFQMKTADNLHSQKQLSDKCEWKYKNAYACKFRCSPEVNGFLFRSTAEYSKGVVTIITRIFAVQWHTRRRGAHRTAITSRMLHSSCFFGKHLHNVKKCFFA